jgi:hypothetical protein
VQIWKGWSTASETTDKSAFTWDEWRACQRCLLGNEQRKRAPQREVKPFSERELARLSFVRWLYHKGCLDPA